MNSPSRRRRGVVDVGMAVRRVESSLRVCVLWCKSVVL